MKQSATSRINSVRWDLSPAETARLKRLWLAGRTCWEIARRLAKPIPERTVSEIAHRLELPHRPNGRNSPANKLTRAEILATLTRHPNLSSKEIRAYTTHPKRVRHALSKLKADGILRTTGPKRKTIWSLK